MVTDWSLISGIGVGIVIGSYITYLQMTIRKLAKRIEDVYFDIPSPSDMAKEIVKIKLPISDLPPEILNKLKQSGGMPGMPSIPNDIESPQSVGNKKPNRMMDYVG